MKKTPITLVFNSPREALEFLERIERELRGHVSGELKLNKVKLYLHARGDDYEKMLHRVHAIYNMSRSRQGRRGYIKYRVDLLQSITNASLPVSPVALVELLRLKGYKVRVESGVIETNADSATISRYYKKLAEIYTYLARIPSTTQTKRLIAVYAAYRNISPEDTIRILEEKGLVRQEGRKLVITRNFKDALKTAISNQ